MPETIITRADSNQILAAGCMDFIRRLAGRVTPEAVQSAALAVTARMGDDSPKAVGIALFFAYEALEEIERATVEAEAAR